MAGIRVHEFVTLDGVFEAPRWTFDFPFDPRMGEAIAALMDPARAILLGRRTYEEFAPAWSARTAEEDPGAPFMNDSPKYVVSGSLASADWSGSTVLGGYDPAAISELKDRVDGDIYVSGSGTLVRALLADGLLDSLHLFVYPLVLGSGRRLFADGAAPSRLTLTGVRTFENGVLLASYAPETAG